MPILGVMSSDGKFDVKISVSDRGIVEFKIHIHGGSGCDIPAMIDDPLHVIQLGERIKAMGEKFKQLREDGTMSLRQELQAQGSCASTKRAHCI